MTYEDLLEKLGENSVEESKEAVRLLAKIADAIISDPKNIKIRTLQKSNTTIAKKVLQIRGGSLCLKLMGFQETSTSFTLPAEAKLNNLYDAKDALLMWKESVELSDTNAEATSSSSRETQSDKRPSIDLSKNEAWSQDNNQKKTPLPLNIPVIKPIRLPPLKALYKHKNAFIYKIEQIFHESLQYENKDLQERARKLIPVAQLEVAAQKRLRVVQEHIKKNKLADPNLSIQDMLILELLQWFKEEFFTWVDTPDCSHCGGKTRFSHMGSDVKLQVYTNRVEVHRCGTCHQFTAFPRYNDLNILLETRKGRCGEWANTFTLLCRAMGWDARFVMDETDHVWTEVYSIAQKRWLHCDSCENVCDTPLIYESGWKKKVSYIMAYSGDEVQDVTWRYTSNHKEVLKRRKNCREKDLIDVLMVLRKNRQEKLSESKRNYLTKRLVLELVELMIERKPDDKENVGRQSGDATWRLARGEIQEEQASREYIWRINIDEMVTSEATVRYSTARDTYELVIGEDVKREVKKWSAGCFNQRNIFLKEEKDWKQIYLARKENDKSGSISWKFEIEGNSKTLDDLLINFQYKTYENGTVSTKICSDDVCKNISQDVKVMTTRNFSGKRSITITTTLSGGKGDVAWQHAQIFRQPLDSPDYPFTISFKFK